ncbi:MAG: TetR/AcrR family transcriptional regulator [Bacteroidetes bacterium]|nr:TetR/AcrR family transcriptional regulator [Bacteroidota bacterium]
MIDKRDHIINKAIELFAVKGFEGTSIRDLAAAADVNVAMVNYYFGTKEKLFDALIERKAVTSRGSLEELVKDKTLSGIEKIDRIIDIYVERLFTHRQFHRVIQQELITDRRETLTQSIVQAVFPNAIAIRTIIETAIKNNEFKKIDVQLTIATLIGTINQVLLSQKYCLKLLEKGPDYIPYDDPKFKKRVIDHIRQLMRDHLLKK